MAPSNRTVRRRGARGTRMSMTFPTIAYVDEGGTVDISLQTVLAGCEQSLSGLPWRLISVRCEAVVLSAHTSTTPTQPATPQPALIQLRVNDAKSTNVESLKAIRWLVYQVPKARTLRPPAPNPWKEDEERRQAVVSIDNISFGGKPTTRAVCYLQLKFQFGPLVYSAASSVAVVASKPSRPLALSVAHQMAGEDRPEAEYSDCGSSICAWPAHGEGGGSPG